MKIIKIVFTLFLFATSPLVFSACNNGAPVRLSEMNYASSQMIVAIERFVLEKGYECKTTTDNGGVLFLLTNTIYGRMDVFPELWPNSTTKAWHKAAEKKKVVAVGDLYPGSYEGWYIPAYVAEKYPDLRKVRDLKDYAKQFKDPEQPSKGGIFSCPPGWICDVLNRNLLKAYGLDQQYNLISPGSGAILDASIKSAYKRKKDIVFYYWGPTALMGELDLVRLEMDPFDAKGFKRNLQADVTNPSTSDFPKTLIQTGLNGNFVQKNPDLADFFSKLSLPTQVANKILAVADEKRLDGEQMADYFFNQYPRIWSAWLPSEVASRVSLALANEKN